MFFRPVFDDRGQPLIQTDSNGRRMIHCLDESGHSVWRPLEEFQQRAPAAEEILEVDLEEDTEAAPAPDVIYPPVDGPAPHRRQAHAEDTPEEQAEQVARAELNRLQLERQATEERARIAAAEAQIRQLWEEQHPAEAESMRRLAEQRANLTLREERRLASPPSPGWKIIGCLLLGGMVAILLSQIFGASADLTPAVIGVGEAAGAIFGVIWWRVEVVRWNRERAERAAAEQRQYPVEANNS
jgi:hypothetical protein